MPAVTLQYSSSFPEHPKLRRKATECLTETVLAFVRIKLEALQKRGCANIPDRALFTYTALPGSLTMDARTKDNYGHKQTEESAVIDSGNRSAVVIEVVFRKRWVFKYRITTYSPEDAHLLWVAMDATRPIPTAPASVPLSPPVPEPASHEVQPNTPPTADEPTPPLGPSSSEPQPPTEDGDRPAPAVKRGRGRPRKNPVEKPAPPEKKTVRKKVATKKVPASKAKASAGQQWQLPATMSEETYKKVTDAMQVLIGAMQGQKTAQDALAAATVQVEAAKQKVAAAEKALTALGVTRS